MNISISEAVFPSYSRIKNNIIRQQTANYQHRIANLQSHLTHMKAAHDFKHEHQQIKHSILTLAPPPESSPFFKDPLKIEAAHRYHPSGQFNAESLNYYIDDDGDSDNNYETFLKFKKKALERDLQEEEMERHENKKQKRKEKEEDQEFFKNLYVPPQQISILQSKANHRSKSANCNARLKTNNPHTQTLTYQQAKENASIFMSSLLKSTAANKATFGKPLRKKGAGMTRTLELQGERNAFENNRKYLTENYLQILKKLQTTNIVKLRVLNPQP